MQRLDPDGAVNQHKGTRVERVNDPCLAQHHLCDLTVIPDTYTGDFCSPRGFGH